MMRFLILLILLSACGYTYRPQLQVDPVNPTLYEKDLAECRDRARLLKQQSLQIRENAVPPGAMVADVLLGGFGGALGGAIGGNVKHESTKHIQTPDEGKSFEQLTDECLILRAYPVKGY